MTQNLPVSALNGIKVRPTCSRIPNPTNGAVTTGTASC
jgi:hypothetical protein